ncbi:unnamed protein product [Medioppia subpectinata]|uniref:Nose resistant-to-fluoxetine protein N-terminal domain-containing protein n=1 Tax=Medioppia subpectinata TaxID=1979941 RepID=A0A7R9L1E5_9ACAR|nr:unnamed protein product [Medioppia subpectinata]CAG2113548.1 unnamed protein product [Medioppia subpectinata]
MKSNPSERQYNGWQKFHNFSKVWAKDYARLNRHKWTDLSKSIDISTECKDAIISTIDGIERLDDWSVQMINSWGKFPASGIFEGTFTDLGAYDQCLSIENNKIIGSAQYCLIDTSLPLPKPMPKHHNLFHLVDVLPDSLKNNNSNKALNKLSKNASFFYWLSLRVGICTPNKCTENDIKLITERVITNMGLEVKKVRCEVKTTATKLNLVQMSALGYGRTYNIKDSLTNPVLQPIFNAGNSVDTFFLIRYLRITPQLAVFMLITFLIPLIGSGPIWHEFVDPNIIDVENMNIIDVENMCLLHTWYLAADMQLHWISFIVVIAMFRSIKWGIFLIIVAIIAFFVSTSAVVFINDFPAVYTNTGRTEFYVNVFTNVVYFRPTPHGISFFVGFGLGYLIHKKRVVKLSKTMQVQRRN